MQALFEILTDLEVLVKLVGVVLAFGIPLGAPVFVDGEAETDWINFLSHDSLKVNCSVWLIQRTPSLRQSPLLELPLLELLQQFPALLLRLQLLLHHLPHDDV